MDMTMNELHTEIGIQAPAERLWQILTDFATFPQWNPRIKRASGEVEPRARLEIH